ncbi:uncharacterized protein LOC120172933 [Hibiscus syriacus]|nr:uncharacterized protein LOC120172933 [Hibiscus syriacus]
MDEFFEARWKSLEEKLNAHGKISSVQLKDVDELRRGCPKIQLSRNSSLPKMSKTSEEKAEKMTLNVKAAEVQLPKSEEKSVSNLSGKNLQKRYKVPEYSLCFVAHYWSQFTMCLVGTSTANSGGCTKGSISGKPPLRSRACKRNSRGSIKCQCSSPCCSHLVSSNC